MYGLIIGQPHLDRILNLWVFYDRRQFNTSKRGRIALVDPADNCIRGYADLTEVVPCSYHDFLSMSDGPRITGDMWASRRPYYEFRFSNVQKLDRPLPIDRREPETVWVEIPDYIVSNKKQKSLFDF